MTIQIIGNKRKSRYEEALLRGKALERQIEEEERRARLEKLKEKQEEEKQEPIVQPVSFDIKNPEKYIQVGINGLYGNPVLISKFELPGFSNLTWKKAHFKLAENGLYMPTPAIFMTHFKNVIDAYEGKKKIYDGKGKELDWKELEDIYLHLTTRHIAVYSNILGAWTWLNAKFVEENGMKIETVIGVNNNGLITKKEPLEACLMKHCYVDLIFNKQGLPYKVSPSQKYEQGKNIGFCYPRDDYVAAFWSTVSDVQLTCGLGSSLSLGVFGCVEARENEIK